MIRSRLLTISILLMVSCLFAMGQDIKELTKKAKKGDATAQFNLAMKYSNGNGVSQDDKQAFYWWKKAAEQGDTDAIDNLGWSYCNGRGVEKDINMAIYFYSQAGEKGSAYSQNNLAQIFFNQKDYDKEFYWSKKSAEQGDKIGQCNLGMCYYHGRGVLRDYEQAAYWFKKSAEQGYADAQANLGFLYYVGHGVPKDVSQFAVWTKAAAVQFNTSAQSNLAEAYRMGMGVLRDYAQAKEYYTMAANQGYGAGYQGIGTLYYLGQGVKQSYPEAYSNYQKAIEKGYVPANANLGDCYLKGRGIFKNHKLAAECYQKAVDGNTNFSGYALARLGLCYENGYGVAKDYAKAYQLYKQAAESAQSTAYGQAGLGSCYEYGHGVAQDYGKAIEWYQKAIDQGTDELDDMDEYHDVKMRLEMLLAKNKTSGNKVHPSQLPILNYVNGSLTFVDKTGGNTINANGSYALRLQVKNTGKGVARHCTVDVKKKGAINGITANSAKVADIAVGETKTIEIPVTADMMTVDGQVEFSLQVNEPNGFGIDPQYITILTRSFVTPLLQITDYSLTSNSGQVLRKKEPFDLQLLLQNTKSGLAENVEVSVSIPQNVLMLDGQEKSQFAAIKGGETQSLVYSLIVNNNYASPTIPIHITLKEKYGKYAENKTVTLKLDQTMASAKLSVNAANQPQQGGVTIARLKADVDQNIPQSTTVQNNRFAVIITNEKYSIVSPVEFAQKDGEVFASYCQQTLGIPKDNIRIYQDATFGKMLAAVADIKRIVGACDGNADVIFYYAGHGVPDESSRDAYLLPTDIMGLQTEACYPVSKLYEELGSMKARQIVVFMDACFSGAQRGDGMLVSARGVALKPKEAAPQGNMVVFSAAQGDETAFPYREKGHGMFTYYLLKKLQESKGDCTLADLADYVQSNVKRQSAIVNRKNQTPCIIPAMNLAASWKEMKLK